MRSHYRAVVIGGGIVGVSVLYHLAKLGWTDVALIERRELTAGSTWHAAAGFHAFNADPTISALQNYTIGLYRELQAESEQALGLKLTGAITLAGTPERWEWLHAALATFRTLGLHDTRLVSPDEIKRLCPLLDVSEVRGGLWDPHDGYLDPSGTTHAFAAAARRRGAEIILRNRVLALEPLAGRGWRIVTEGGTIEAEHVVNAGGLWARHIGRMAGVDLPVTPFEHHYLVTEPIPEIEALTEEIPTVVDLEAFTYARQEGKGLLLGVYEQDPKHWHMEGAPWDYGVELLPPDIDRISPELELGFARYPALARAGIKRWVNGPFTFTPDGNPMVGPVPGLDRFWCACGVMAGFSQGGGVGLALARWMVEGEPGLDVFGMDVARFPGFAANRPYLAATTRQFYATRYLIGYPNEQRPAGRPLRVPGAYDAMTADGARWGSSRGLEVPLYYAPAGFVETPSFRRSEAHAIVGAECRAVREAAGLLDVSATARYAVSGPGARRFLDRLLASRLPEPGRASRALMLSRAGRLLGDFTLLAWDEAHFWLVGPSGFRDFHLRAFGAHLPAEGVTLHDISDAVAGFALSGPRAHDILAAVAAGDVSDAAMPPSGCTTLDVGLSRARVARLSGTGERGYEIVVAAGEHRTLYMALKEAGRAFGLAPIGTRAAESLRLEKSYGTWGREFTQADTPASSGLAAAMADDKPDFVGRDAALASQEAALAGQDGGGAPRRLATLVIDAEDADASPFEPVWQEGRLVGHVTSGAYGHTCGLSLALATVEAGVAAPGTALAVDVFGQRRPTRVVPPSPYDPAGERLRIS